MEKAKILLLKSRDIQTFDSLVKEYERKIYNYAYNFTKNHDDALDITQEVFLKIHKNIDKFKEDSSLSTWIYRITANVCIDFSRKNKYTVPITEENEEYVFQIADGTAKVEKNIINNELREEITTSLRILDADSRQIIILRDVLGFSYSKISEVLELEEGTVKSRISRSRKKLREIILKSRNKNEDTTSNNIEAR